MPPRAYALSRAGHGRQRRGEFECQNGWTRLPAGTFDVVEEVISWHDWVLDHAVVLVTDQYAPFQRAA